MSTSNSYTIEESLKINIIQKISRSKIIKNYIYKKFNETNFNPLKGIKILKPLQPLEPIIINSEIEEEYITDINVEGYVKKVKPYVTKWN